MKILVIGRFYEEGFATFVADELAHLGHEPVRHDPGPRLVSFGSRARFYLNRALETGHRIAEAGRRSLGLAGETRRLRQTLERAGGVDLVLSTHDHLTPADARAVRQLAKAPLALWYPDPVWSFRRHMFLNAPYDFLFFKDPYLVRTLRAKLGKPAYYMPECYSPRALAPEMAGDATDPRHAADICTAGNLYAYRVALFRELADRDLKIWGLPAPLWMELGALAPRVQNRFVAHAEKVRAFRGAKIVLNTLNPSEIWGTNLRTFEACGAGAFQITDWRPGLGQLFEIGREIVAFDDLADLRRLIDRYLAAPEERREIAAAGHRRALRDHTYAVRLGQLLATVEGRAAGYPEPEAAWQPPGSAASRVAGSGVAGSDAAGSGVAA